MGADSGCFPGYIGLVHLRDVHGPICVLALYRPAIDFTAEDIRPMQSQHETVIFSEKGVRSLARELRK